MSLLAWLEAATARWAVAGLRRLRPDTASNLCGGVARTIGPWLPVSRVADGNLQRVLPELDAAARARVIRGVWDNLGRNVGEFPHLGTLGATESGPGLVVDDAAGRMLAALPRPLLVLAAHIGNWEAMPVAAARYGMQVASVYRPSANAGVDAVIQSLRRAAAGGEVTLFPKGASGARGALAHLKAGGALAMLMDQKMNDGIEALFFGQPAMTASALAALAVRFECPVVPVHVERLGPARLRVVIEPPLALPPTGDRVARVARFTQAVNDHLEGWVRARPESWLWLHRRWPKM